MYLTTLSRFLCKKIQDRVSISIDTLTLADICKRSYSHYVRLLIEVMTVDLVRRNYRSHARLAALCLHHPIEKEKEKKERKRRKRSKRRMRVPWGCGRWRRCDAAAWRMPVRLRRLRYSRPATSCPRAVRSRRCPAKRAGTMGGRAPSGLVKVDPCTMRAGGASLAGCRR